jgi:hypothetical protein
MIVQHRIDWLCSLGRTNHASYHFGQMMLAKPKTP